MKLICILTIGFIFSNVSYEAFVSFRLECKKRIWYNLAMIIVISRVICHNVYKYVGKYI